MRISSFLVVIFSLTLTPGNGQLHGYRQGKIYTYDVHSTAFTSPAWTLPSDALDNYSIQYELKSAPVGTNKIRFQCEKLRVFQKEPLAEILPPEEIRKYFEAPGEVTVDSSAQPISMKLQFQHPDWALNIKKSLVSMFILNTGSTSRRITTNVDGATQIQYSVQEKSSFGQCEAKYTVQEGSLSQSSAGQRSSDDLTTEDTNSDENSENQNSGTEPREWSSEEQDETHLNELRAFCGANSKMFEFRKSNDLRYCQKQGRTLNQTGILTSQFVTCGPERKFVIYLEVSTNFHSRDTTVAQKAVLVGIDPFDRSQFQTFPASSIQISDFTFNNLQAEFNLASYLAPNLEDQIEPEQTSFWRKHKTSGDRIDRYRRCIEGNGIMPTKFVSRDLNSEYYNHLNLQWNLRKQKVYPLAYFLPTSAQDVSSAVKCGLETNIHLVPNSGGHSYEGIGWGTNETLVVDFRNMRNISIEGSGANAVGRLEPGALVGPVNAYFWENGGYAMPMGNCLTVGMGGHAIGGGVGYFSTQYGLAVDNVVEFEMVDGRGQIVVANERENPDLFWALRGHGPGYIGIVTSFKVKLFEASKINITLVRLRYQVKQFAPAFIGFQNMMKWMKANEPTAFIGFMMASDTYNATYPPVSPGIEFSAVHIQDPNIQPKNYSEFVRVLLEKFPQPAEIIQSFPNYIQFVVMTGYAPIVIPHAKTGQLITVGKLTDADLYFNSHTTRFMDLPADAEIIAFLNSMHKDLAAPRYFKAKSFLVKKYFTRAQMDAVAAVLQRIPQNNIWILCNSEQGAIHDFQKTEMSYVHRDSLLDITIHYEGSSDPAQVQQGMKFLYELWDTVQFMDGGETYQNYPDLDVKDHLIRNYGQNLIRLQLQKQKWDPTNFFVTPLSLPRIVPPRRKNNSTAEY